MHSWFGVLGNGLCERELGLEDVGGRLEAVYAHIYW